MSGEADGGGAAPVPADAELDMSGYDCPMPVLRAKVALGKLEAGEVLHVIATDPFSVQDFRDFCDRTGHELLEHSGGAQRFEFWIRRRAGSD